MYFIVGYVFNIVHTVSFSSGECIPSVPVHFGYMCLNPNRFFKHAGLLLYSSACKFVCHRLPSFKQLIPNNLSNLCFFCVQLDITAAEEGLQTEIAADGCL